MLSRGGGEEGEMFAVVAAREVGGQARLGFRCRWGIPRVCWRGAFWFWYVMKGMRDMVWRQLFG